MFVRARAMSWYLVGVLSVGAGHASADDPAAVPDAPLGKTQAAAKSDYEKKPICRMEAVAGSHIKKKVCRTQAQMDAERETSQSSLSTLNGEKGAITDAKGG